jgi:hypothetical protein
MVRRSCDRLADLLAGALERSHVAGEVVVAGGIEDERHLVLQHVGEDVGEFLLELLVGARLPVVVHLDVEAARIARKRSPR